MCFNNKTKIFSSNKKVVIKLCQIKVNENVYTFLLSLEKTMFWTSYVKEGKKRKKRENFKLHRGLSLTLLGARYHGNDNKSSP